MSLKNDGMRSTLNEMTEEHALATFHNWKSKCWATTTCIAFGKKKCYYLPLHLVQNQDLPTKLTLLFTTAYENVTIFFCLMHILQCGKKMHMYIF
jgi:predicted MarR family transcription regulator